MAKLFKETTFAKFKAEGTHELNKIYFIKDKGMMFANGMLYSHNTTDTVTTGGVVEVLAPTVNLTTNSIVTITDFDISFSGIKEFTLINNCNVSNIIELGKKINSYGEKTSLELHLGDSVKFSKESDGTWTINYIMNANKLVFPALIPDDIKNDEKKVMVMDKEGNYSSINFTEMKAWDNTVTNDLNNDTLNQSYPNAVVGFQVICVNGGKTYEMVDSTTKTWVSYNITKLS